MANHSIRLLSIIFGTLLCFRKVSNLADKERHHRDQQARLEQRIHELEAIQKTMQGFYLISLISRKLLKLVCKCNSEAHRLLRHLLLDHTNKTEPCRQLHLHLQVIYWRRLQAALLHHHFLLPVSSISNFFTPITQIKQILYNKFSCTSCS